MFFHFSNFELQYKEMCQVLMKNMEPDDRGNNLKIASFLVFFKMLLFETQSAFLARHDG